MFLQRKEEKNALRSKKKWLRWHFSAPSEGKNKRGNGRMKGGKTRIYKEFLDIFCQDSRKKSIKNWIERRGIPCVFIVLNEGIRIVPFATTELIINTIQSTPHSSRIAFRSSIVSLRVSVIKGH